MVKAHWMLSLQTASLILMRILRFSHIDSHTQEHMPIVDCVLLPLQCSWKQQMHEPRLYHYKADSTTHELHSMSMKNESPPNSPMCPSSVQLCRENWIYVVVVMLSRWLLTGGIWANLREQGDFLLLLWFPLIQDYTKTPPHSNYHILHDHRIHQLINFNTIFIEDIIAFFSPFPSFQSTN